MKICIARIEGTNCEDETKRAFDMLNADSEIVHLKQLIGDCIPERKRNLSDYDALIFPGGFSAGDYVRGGAIWTARVQSRLKAELDDFVKQGKVVGGICNGFQVLTSLGLLPGSVQAALTTNESSKFECRFTYLKTLRDCAFTKGIETGKVLCFPIGHQEGRLTFLPGKEKDALKTLQENDQIIFQYVNADGSLADRKYPANPNGSILDIAGVCNQEGNIFGLMPHPERVLDRFNHFDWTRNNSAKEGDGLVVFKSLVEYINNKV